ncbi:unnamed protein product, partial [Polarella glacialis]
DVLGMWALIFLWLTAGVWVGVTVHDLALISNNRKDFILDVTGVNRYCPLIPKVWSTLAGYRMISGLVASPKLSARLLGLVLAIPLAPVLIAWNFVALMFVMCPLILLVFMRHPIRMSRAWVFIASIVCFFYGLALTLQGLAYVCSQDLRPRYALTWQPEQLGNSTAGPSSVCTCGCDYDISFSVCMNLTVIGAMTTLKSCFLALRCLKGLRRSQWASLLTVEFPVPLTAYSVDWRRPDGKPIQFRTEEMPVQGEVAFDPFALMDEQPESAFTTVTLLPEPVHNFKDGVLVKPLRKLEAASIPMPEIYQLDSIKVTRAEYIGCCGFAWPTGGTHCVYDDEFLEALEANGPEIVPEMLTRSKSGISASLHTPLGATKLGNFADDESPSENEEIPRFGDPRDHS